MSRSREALPGLATGPSHAVPESPDPICRAGLSVFADFGTREPPESPAMGYLNLKLATCNDPSSSLTTSWRQVFAHVLLVFQT